MPDGYAPAMRVIAVAVVFAVLSSACGGGSEESDRVATTTGFTDPAREQFEWLVGAARNGELGADVLEERFSTELLDAIGGLGLIQGLVELGLTTEEWEVVEAEFGLFEGVAVLRNADGDRIQMLVGTRSVPPYEIDELRATPISPEIEGGLTADAVDERLQDTGTAHWGIFEVADGACTPLAGTESDTPAPISRVFDLWVLAALAEAVESGDASFGERFAVDDAVKSSLDGRVGVAAAGTELPLRRYAELMISIQDNSAADHLIARLGRDAVEEAMVNAGVAAPELNRPLLTTREFFVLKFTALRDSVDDYLALDSAGRRAYLDGELSGVSVIEAGLDGPGWDAPTLVTEIEWFASPSDLCRTHAHLAQLALRPGLREVADVLALNPGVPLDTEVWTGFQFKSGSELGVFAGSWLLTRADGRTFVVAGSVFDTEQLVDEADAIALFQALIELAAVA